MRSFGVSFYIKEGVIMSAEHLSFLPSIDEKETNTELKKFVR
ncbi:hypothetical protein CHCC20372_1121 [Bacillus paralicheniformis]|nr:hypothetical protein CHCC20372_1121 [Bacillus paralicheniformis]TWK44606.1 hypothetical protein CHCC20348_2233 [Bacillus paralicheniformis]